MKGTRTMQNRKILAIFAVSLCLCAGCWDAKSMGLGRRPLIPATKPLIFTEAEKNELTAWRNQNAELFDRIVIANNVKADLIKTYNKEALRVNEAQLKALGYDSDEIQSTLYAGLRKMGYAATDDLAKDYAPKPEKQ